MKAMKNHKQNRVNQANSTSINCKQKVNKLNMRMINHAKNITMINHENKHKVNVTTINDNPTYK